jgi:hypothetical protein
MAQWSIFNSRKVRQGLKGSQIYQFFLGRRFDPGAEAEVFQPTLSNPVVLFRGNSRLAGVMAVYQSPQAFVPANIGVAGIGGVQGGQIYSQPLIDPSQLDDSGG